MLAARVEEVSKPCVELALDAVGSVWRAWQDARLSKDREMSGDTPDLMSDIEGLHPSLQSRNSMSKVE